MEQVKKKTANIAEMYSTEYIVELWIEKKKEK